MRTKIGFLIKEFLESLGVSRGRLMDLKPGVYPCEVGFGVQALRVILNPIKP